MKSATTKWMMTAAMAALTMVGVANAESLSEHKADVPFGFRVGNESMPPGKYAIGWKARDIFTFRHVETGRMVAFLGALRRDASAKGGAVAFRCAGEACVLEAVKPVGSSIQYGRIFPKAPAGALPTAVIRVALR
ncbi:MAG: hypothetical protein JNK87_10600 [Bryobacterales bacterium]|nr:hypothetical protein [Bryobacterales bacterium]